MIVYYFLKTAAVLFFMFVIGTVTLSKWQKSKQREQAYKFEPVMYKDVLERGDP